MTARSIGAALIRGDSAVNRARQLDAMRQSGAKQVITWADFVYTVVVQNFEADFTKQGYRIPYRISCLVIPQPKPPTKPGLFDSVVNDLSNAVGLDGLAATAQQAITYAQAALPVVGVITGGGSAFINLSTTVGQASGVVGGLTSLSDSQVGGLATAANAIGKVIPGGDALTAVASLQSAASSTPVASGKCAGCQLYRAYCRKFEGGTAMKTIVVSGADVSLFHIAARELLDATQWIRIAEANSIDDPMITSSTTLIIPDVDTDLTGRPAAGVDDMPDGSLFNPTPQSIVRRPRLRFLINGDALTGCYSASVSANNRLAANTWEADLAMDSDPGYGWRWWGDQKDATISVQMAFIAEGQPEGQIATWTTLIVGKVDDIHVDPNQATVHLAGRGPHFIADRHKDTKSIRE